jgi:hypothetical protein
LLTKQFRIACGLLAWIAAADTLALAHSLLALLLLALGASCLFALGLCALCTLAGFGLLAQGALLVFVAALTLLACALALGLLALGLFALVVQAFLLLTLGVLASFCLLAQGTLA